jgi:lysophospholipase L1-like esterase
MLRVPTAVLLVVIVGAGCGKTGNSSSPSTRKDGTTTVVTTAATAPTVLPPGSRYVALGSSFAAGPGIPRQGTGCARSDHNYPHLVAIKLQLQLVDVSCSGATTANVLQEPQLGHPPQIDAVTADTSLITLTVGGNDIQYSATTLACAQDPACMASVNRAAIDAALAALPARLEELVAALRSRAPHAIVVLVTYVQVVPPGPPCANLALPPDAAAFLQDLGQGLEDAFLTVAKSAQVLLADPYALAAGHGPCAPAGQAWVAGLHAPLGFPYHPTAVGHQAIASLVIAALQHH